MSMLPIGTKVYYTGDMANVDGHFTVFSHRHREQYDLAEIDGPRRLLGVMHIAERVYAGERFYTEAAWRLHREERIAEMQRSRAELDLT
jgi:hypothetical protein